MKNVSPNEILSTVENVSFLRMKIIKDLHTFSVYSVVHIYIQEMILSVWFYRTFENNFVESLK